MIGIPGSAVVPGGLLALVLVFAVWTDVRSRRIPNTLILVGWTLAACWQLFGPQGTWVFDPAHPGAVGLLGAIGGAALLLLAFLLLHLLGVMGAGDVKLMSVVGAFFGVAPDAWMQLVGVALFVLAAGGILAVLRMLVSGSSAAVFANLRIILAGHAAGVGGKSVPGAFDARTGSADRMPYAVAIATGTISYVVAKWAGWITVL